jgi:hypothetical protein
LRIGVQISSLGAQLMDKECSLGKPSASKRQASKRKGTREIRSFFLDFLCINGIGKDDDRLLRTDRFSVKKWLIVRQSKSGSDRFRLKNVTLSPKSPLSDAFLDLGIERPTFE